MMEGWRGCSARYRGTADFAPGRPGKDFNEDRGDEIQKPRAQVRLAEAARKEGFDLAGGRLWGRGFERLPKGLVKQGQRIGRGRSVRGTGDAGIIDESLHQQAFHRPRVRPDRGVRPRVGAPNQGAPGEASEAEHRGRTVHVFEHHQHGAADRSATGGGYGSAGPGIGRRWLPSDRLQPTVSVAAFRTRCRYRSKRSTPRTGERRSVRAFSPFPPRAWVASTRVAASSSPIPLVTGPEGATAVAGRQRIASAPSW